MSDRARAERSWGLGRLLCLLLFAYAIAVALGAFAPPRAAAAEDPAPRSQDAASGKLFVRTLPGGELIAAPLLSTEVKIAVSGLVARAQVRQSFRNAGTDWVEGVYVFPLPENSAVDRLRLRIGERTVEGRIAEREAAQREYTAARNEGRRVGLVEQERPNMFTTSIANIGPSETIVVEIEYQDTPRFDHGAFELRFPLVVGPRYIPGNPLVASTRGWAGVTDLVADADRITPPVRDPAEGPGNPVTIEVTLDAGMALAEVRSATHRIVVTPAEQNRMHVRLADETVPADRDFELTWAPAVGTAPRAGLFVEHRDGESHLLLMIVPPDRPAPEVRTLPREAIFIIDTSGSMAGTSIVQAKAALRLALDRLSPRDRFNIIEFNSTASALFGSAQLADAEALRKARNFVDGLRANGGTEMRAALDLALDGRRDPGRIRQIVFLTDGLVGNEAALFPKIVEGLGDSRLFTVGIGSAPNQWFMTRGARAGRGTFTNISRIEEVERRMSALFEKLEKPVLTDLAARWPAGVTVEGYPDPLPDLYAGEPVVIAAKPPPGGLPVGTVVTLTGRFGSEAWSESLSLDHHAEADRKSTRLNSSH